MSKVTREVADSLNSLYRNRDNVIVEQCNFKSLGTTGFWVLDGEILEEYRVAIFRIKPKAQTIQLPQLQIAS